MAMAEHSSYSIVHYLHLVLHVIFISLYIICSFEHRAADWKYGRLLDLTLGINVMVIEHKFIWCELF